MFFDLSQCALKIFPAFSSGISNVCKSQCTLFSDTFSHNEITEFFTLLVQQYNINDKKGEGSFTSTYIDLQRRKITKYIPRYTQLIFPLWIFLLSTYSLKNSSMQYKCNFSSNKIVQKISFSLCFWASDPLINKFYLNQSNNRSEAQNQRPNEIL